MKIIDDIGLEPLFAAVSKQGGAYTKGDAEFSVSELLSPPRISALLRKHGADLSENASDRIYALLGSLMAQILYDHKGTASIAEKRYSIDVAGAVVSGQPDHFSLAPGSDNGWDLLDWKLASVWEHIRGLRPEREQQLNSYAEILRGNGFKIVSLEIVAVFRDWSKPEARRELDKATKMGLDCNYPQAQVARIPVPLWPRDKALAFLAERIKLHVAARTELPLCTDEERWARDESWAIVKRGADKATRVFPTMHDAAKWLEEDPIRARKLGDFEVVRRPGGSIRCEMYCAVAEKCSQWAAERGEA